MMAHRGLDVTCGAYDGGESVIVIGRLVVPLSMEMLLFETPLKRPF